MTGYEKIKLMEPFMHQELGDGAKTFIPFYAIKPLFELFEEDIKVHYDRMEFQMMFPIKANNLGQVFAHMQGEIWSPNGEANTLVKELGLMHTSMSVGDVIFDCMTNIYYIVKAYGFKAINLI